MKKLVFIVIALLALGQMAFAADGNTVVGFVPSEPLLYSPYPGVTDVAVSAAWDNLANAYLWTYVVTASGTNNIKGFGFANNDVASLTINFAEPVADIMDVASLNLNGATMANNGGNSYTFTFATPVTPSTPATITSLASTAEFQSFVSATTMTSPANGSFVYETNVFVTPAVPEPAGVLAIASGLVGLTAFRRSRK